LRQARVRKVSLQSIFSAIEEEKFQLAAKLCVERFQSKGLFWLFAARMGAELLLRVGRFGDAQTLYQAVVEAKPLPWAKLGVARAQIEAGQVTQASSTLENMISDDPSYTDAYDVMGRAQFELGRFDKALETYKMAATLTPASISRLQNVAMMTYYAGDHTEAEKLLDRTTRLGVESKMFDSQTLVLLAFTRLELADRKGLQRCHDDFLRLIERNPDNARQQRLAEIVATLNSIQKQQFAPSVEAVKVIGKTVKNPDFDFESASNLLTLMSHLAQKSIQVDNVESVVDTIGLRFCNSRALTELLVISVKLYPPYAERIRACQAKIIECAEVAMALIRGGNSTAAVKNLILHGKDTLNARLIDNAYQVVQKHGERIQDSDLLMTDIFALRAQNGNNGTKASLGEQKRQAGGLILRTAAQPVPAPVK
jgi:Flp pilus assembly protein TadD